MNANQVSSLGYDVSLSSDAYADGDVTVPAVYFVRGFGVELYIRADDTDAWDSLLDSAAHAERVDQAENGLPEPEPAPAAPNVPALVAAALANLPEGPLTREDLGPVIAALVGG